MRRSPVFDPHDDHDDPNAPPGNVHRINTAPDKERYIPRRGEVRQFQGARRVPTPQGPNLRVWFIRGTIGVAALAGLWLGLQALFPVSESRVTQAPAPTPPVDASAVGVPEPPAAIVPVAPPAAIAQQPATSAAAEGDRLPGLPTPAPAQPTAAAPTAAPAQPTAAPTAPPAQPTPIPPPNAQAAAQAAADAQARAQAQQSSGPAPVPTAESANAPAAAAPSAPSLIAAAPAPAQKPQAAQPPPPAPATGGPFELAASASPANPVSENAVVTITVKATQNGAPLAGVGCMATIHYRTNTVRQPSGGFSTNGNGVGSFTLDARGTTYGYYVPVDVTCSGRGGSVTARTGFTPVKGR